jgi:hypothetical protein
MTKSGKNGHFGLFWPLLVINGHHKNYVYHGNVVCPLEKHQKCGTEQKTRGQNIDPIKNYRQNTDFCHFSLFLAPFYSVKTAKRKMPRGGYEICF